MHWFSIFKCSRFTPFVKEKTYPFPPYIHDFFTSGVFGIAKLPKLCYPFTDN